MSLLEERRIKQYDQPIKGIDDAIPKNILIELTNACNHKCNFCFNPKSLRKPAVIDINLMSKILEEAFDMGIKEVGFYGTGEPLLVQNITERIAIAKKIGFEYLYLTTNGSLRDDNFWEDLVKNSGLSSIKFSINAGTKETYRKIHGKDDFDKVIHRVRFVSKLIKKIKVNCHLAVSFVATKESEKSYNSLSNLLKDHVDEFLLYGTNNQIGYLDNKDKKGKIVSRNYKLPCSMIFNRVHISSEGYLTACCEDYQNYLASYDLKKLNLSKAWNGKIMNNLRKKHLNKDLKNLICESCIFGTKTDDVQPLDKKLFTPIPK